MGWKRSSSAVLLLLLAAFPAQAADYVWPLSNRTTRDSMNTSFGPRINYSMWDMHDGIDLPAAVGTRSLDSNQRLAADTTGNWTPPAGGGTQALRPLE